MTTEELENKLKISNDTRIHCPTLELAKQVLSIFHQLGLRWKDDTHYTLDPNWNNFKEDTVYHPFTGECSSLVYAHAIGYKIINAEEFILLHTEGEKFDLENYEPKGDLKGFPKEIIARMLDYQEEQGNLRDVSIFERDRREGQCVGGFEWYETKEGKPFWYDIINNEDFSLFFEKYPKQDHQDNSQEFRVGDEVIDIITRQRGKISEISTDGIFSTYVNFNEEGYTLDGKDKYPRLLHYRDDYNYDVIDFNNLPKRQEPKRWRAEKGEPYYSFTPNFEVEGFCDKRFGFNNRAYDSGNYFKTKEEAQEMADKLNKYFQELINTNK